MTFLDIALDCTRRGWYVFPCKPKSKKPLGRLAPNGWQSASKDETVIRGWWTDTPAANVAIACNQSDIAVLDCDEGNAYQADFEEWAKSLPTTYTVRTGRRVSKTGTPEFGTQLYFAGAVPDVALWKLSGRSGQVKSLGGYVMAAGSVHPDSGEQYSVLVDAPLARTPDAVRELRTFKSPVVAGKLEKIPEGAGRHAELIRIAGFIRNSGLNRDEIYDALVPINPARCEVPIPDDDLAHIADSAGSWPVTDQGPQVIIGKLATKEPDADPWAKYHSMDDLLNVPPGKFIVEGVLFENSITALAGYAGDRKSIVSLNLAAACVTGKPFMGRFAVANPPKRVIYLCPEMGLRELSKLAKSLGMLPYVGKTLFFRSLDKAGKLKLPDLTPVELDGSLVILDTAVRFIEGKENDPQDMAAFSDELFRLRSQGATVWVLFHSSKASVGQELSLQNAVRGSSEIAAMLSMCWATRLNEPAKRFESTSRVYPLKVREFEALPFDFGCDRSTAACSIIGEPGTIAALKSRKADEKRVIIEELLRHDPNMGVNKLIAVVKVRTGSGCNAKWAALEKKRILNYGKPGVAVEED